MRDIERVDGKKHFPLAVVSQIRGPRFKLRSMWYATVLRKDLFTQKVLEIWNVLP